MNSSTVHRLGFTVLAPGDKNGAIPLANVVFVHGLRGHPSKTWEQATPQQTHGKEEAKSSSSLFSRWRGRERSKSPVITEKELSNDCATSICWPRDLLPHRIPNARILTYGYDADIIGSLFQGASKNSITQHGQDLMLQLERVVNGEPIIFVAHSLGGILVKWGLHWSKSHLTPKYQELHRCTKHIIFLGVPHRGSQVANSGEILTRLANAALQDTNRHILSSLEVDGEILDTIHSEFMKMMHKEDFSVHSFQEGRGISGLKSFSGKVVNDFSSKLDHPLEVVETIDGNHMQMARFSDVEDPGYHKVSSTIAGYILRLVQERSVENPAATMATAFPVVLEETRKFRVPHISNRYFVGRAKELEWLQKQLKEPLMQEDQRRVVIWGCGGAGKTQLVSTYALRNQTEFSAVFWVTASSELTLKKTYADIARHLGLATLSNSTMDGNVQQTMIDLVRDWFTDHQRGDWLLVIDNADNLEEVDIMAFIPPTNKGNVIITTRNKQAEGFGPAIELGAMDSVDATSLLLRRAAIHQPTSTDQALAFEITKSLGYLALAVEHAGAYIQAGGGSLLEYKEQFETNRRVILEKSPAVSMHKDSVFETFTISFEKIKERNMAAARLLTFLGFLDSEAILENLMLSNHEDITVFWGKVVPGPSEFHAAVQELLSFSLIRVKLYGNIKSISLHPLVHYFSRARLTIEKQWRWTEIAVCWVLQSSTATRAYESYHPHLQELLQQIKSLKILPKDLETCRRVWCYLGLLLQHHQHMWHSQGRMNELNTYAKMAMTLLEEDPNNRESLSIVSKMAVVLVQVNTAQYMDCGQTPDEVLRRYLLTQMTPYAATALQNAHNRAISSISTARAAAIKKIKSEGDVPFSQAEMVIPIDYEIMSGPISVEELAEEANDFVEQRGSIGQREIVGPGSIIRDSNINPAVSSTPSIAKNVTSSANASSIQPGPALSDLKASILPRSNEQGTTDESPSQILPSTVSSPSSKPQYLSDIFLGTDPPIYIQSLKSSLRSLAQIYASNNRTAEADLLLEYSALPIDSSQISNQPHEISQLLSELGRFAAQKDLEGLLNTFPKIVNADPLGDQGHILEIQYCAIEYAILLNKLRRCGEAEMVIKRCFYGSEEAEEARARELKVMYVWVRKTLARALSLRGRVKEEYVVLCETLEIAEEVFGRNSLQVFHARLLLRGLCGESGKWERYTQELDECFTNMYGAGPGEVRKEGFQMGMILWAQGALEEAVSVFECFIKLANGALGEDDPLTKKARRANVLAQEESASERRAEPGADLCRFGTILFSRKMDDLALLVENEIA